MIFEYLADSVYWKRKLGQWDDEKLDRRFRRLLGPDSLWPLGTDERLETLGYSDQPFSELRAIDRERWRRYDAEKLKEWEEATKEG